MMRTLASVLGVVFLAAGLIGFFAPGLMGFHLSPIHNIIHLVSGAATLYFVSRPSQDLRRFCIGFGLFYGLLAVVGLLSPDGVSQIPAEGPDANLLTVDPQALVFGTSDHVFHLLIAALYLVAGYAKTQPGSPVDQQAGRREKVGTR